jgi:predicted NBD/HSP70 family sugar kinase
MSLFGTALNTNEARNRNLAAVLQAVRDRPTASRKELGRLMPFSLQTMTNVVQELIDMGMLQEVDRPASGSRGNPHRGLQVVGGGGFVLAVQFRWNACILALVDLDLNVQSQRTIAIDTAEDDTEGYMRALCNAVSQALQDEAGKDIWAVAVSGPLTIGVLNMPHSAIEFSQRLPDQRWFNRFAGEYTSAMLGERLARECGTPVFVFNNSQAAALAEAQVRPHESRFVYILAGLGLGTSFISSGAVSRDVWKHGGEMGHVVYRGQTLSAVLSASGLRRSINIDAAHGEMEPILARMAEETPERFDPWLHEAGPIFRFLINFLEAALWPDGIAVSGFIPTPLIDRLIEAAMPLQGSVVLPADDPRRIMPRLYRARHGAEAIPFGAACGVLSYRANPDLVALIAARRS